MKNNLNKKRYRMYKLLYYSFEINNSVIVKHG